MNEKIKEIIIMLILPAFQTLIGLFEDEIKGVISQSSTMVLFAFIWVSIIGELIYLALKNVQRKNEVKKLEDEVKKYKNQNDFSQKNMDLLQNYVMRLESSVKQSFNLDQPRRVIEDYHTNRELIYYTLNEVFLSVFIDASNYNDDNAYDTCYKWRVEGQANKAIDNSIINDFIVSLSCSQDIDKNTLALKVKRTIDNINKELKVTEYELEERSRTEYAVHIPYGRSLAVGNKFVFEVSYTIKQGFRAPEDRFEFTPSNCKYGKVKKFRFYIESNKKVFETAIFKRQNVDQQGKIENKHFIEYQDGKFNLNYEIQCKDYEAIRVETSAT